MGILLLWAIAAYGMTSILVWGAIFENQRIWIKSHSKFFGDLIGCTLCTSTWVGFFMSLVAYSPWHEIIGLNQYVSIFFDGMLASGFVWALNGVVEWFEENRPNNNVL
jgi:hypothetical protein